MTRPTAEWPIWFGFLLWFGLTGCEQPSKPQGLVAEARFGVFYGGQIQERQEVPRVFEPGRQSQGFRLIFRKPLAQDIKVRWEVEQPGPVRGSPKVLNVSRLGEVTAQSGQTELDQLVSFEPGDPVGLWNARVIVGQDLVLDRAWLVFDPAARERSKQRQTR